jgi:hypothetical protein
LFHLRREPGGSNRFEQVLAKQPAKLVDGSVNQVADNLSAQVP